MTCKKATTEANTPFSYVGPDLNEGLMPAIFYFALSDKESLCQDPYNQPVVALKDLPLRIFSLTLPCHDLGLSPNDSLKKMAEEMEKNPSLLQQFISQIKDCFSYLEQIEAIKKEKVGLMGLSRGGFIVSHLAAQEPAIKHLLQFAPLTRTSYTDTFKHLPQASSLDVHHLADKLYQKAVRIYIGNRDLRVGTENAFSFCQALVEKAFSHKIRSPQVELILSPPIGHQGHGTTPTVFKEGALWLANQLL